MDYNKLGNLASEVITKVMKDGEEKYPDNDFMKRPLSEHYDHAIEHLLSFMKGYDTEDLEHALTRLTIILAKARKEWEH